MKSAEAVFREVENRAKLANKQLSEILDDQNHSKEQLKAAKARYHAVVASRISAKELLAPEIISAQEKFQPPDFDYTGELRPGWYGPPRHMPSNEIIVRPDYFKTGASEQEADAKKKNILIVAEDEDSIERLREAGSIARKVLDTASKVRI